LATDAKHFVELAGGKILGEAAYPFPGTSDFAALLLNAQNSGANVIAFANSGTDLANCLKPAKEFGLTHAGVRLAGMIFFITDVLAVGIENAQGTVTTETFYWDLNDRTRAFYQRLKPTLPRDTFPNMGQAGAYSAGMHYFKAIQQMGVAQAKASGRATVETMKRMPTDDDCFGPGSIRVDGRKIHPGLSVPGQIAAGQQKHWRRLYADRDHPGRPGVPPARRWRLLLRDALISDPITAAAQIVHNSIQEGRLFPTPTGPSGKVAKRAPRRLAKHPRFIDGATQARRWPPVAPRPAKGSRG
jgi:hypothetical protein